MALTVCDVEASEAWYGRVLGLQRAFVEPHNQSDAGGYSVVLGAEGVPINIGHDHHPAHRGEAFDPVRTGLDHICFQAVANRGALDDWIAHLDREGVVHCDVVEFEAMGMAFALVSLTDPDGIAFELMSVT